MNEELKSRVITIVFHQYTDSRSRWRVDFPTLVYSQEFPVLILAGNGVPERQARLCLHFKDDPTAIVERWLVTGSYKPC
jgi:hypothetical protein